VPRTVVCLSASDGAAGEDIAPLLADRLGVEIVDEEVIARAAAEAGVAEHVAAEVEQRKSLAARLLDPLTVAGLAAGTSGLIGLPAIDLDDLAPSADRLRALIRGAIEEIAKEGPALIVAHAASFALGARPGTLRVFVTASPETRRRRVASAHSVDDGDAERLVARGDRNRADYLKRFYGVTEQPIHYDLVINTDTLTADEAADVIAQAARA
jgi:cytidylate kinase